MVTGPIIVIEWLAAPAGSKFKLDAVTVNNATDRTFRSAQSSYHITADDGRRPDHVRRVGILWYLRCRPLDPEHGKRFGALTVLDDASLDLARGEALGIVGPNEAGKTTLLSVLSCAQIASTGVVSFRGREVTRLPASERCRLGLVRTHQIPQPFWA